MVDVQSLPALAGHTASVFAQRFGGRPEGLAAAPGRVNLIGEHTDYNDGFVMPMAIDRHAVVAWRRRPDRVLRAHSVTFAEAAGTSLEELAPAPGRGWFAYVAGAAWALEREGLRLPGLDLVVDGTVPVGAGLSSSAALEVAVARACCAAAGAGWDPVRMALACQRAEHEFVGTRCGVMDQFAAACSRAGCALLLDCRSLATEAVPLPPGATVVVMDTGASRALAGSAYNARRASCQRAVEALRHDAPHVRTLRDVTLEQLEACRSQLDETTWRRARHVVEEIERPRALADSLRHGDLRLAGRLMDASHQSLRTLYDVSSAELDHIVSLARAHAGCFGARMTGAGFGGCAIALVQEGAAADFIATVEAAYNAAGGPTGTLFACRPVAGASLIS